MAKQKSGADKKASVAAKQPAKAPVAARRSHRSPLS